MNHAGAASVLVVDGDPQAVMGIKQALEQMDEYTVIVARDGPECIQQAAEKLPDLILLDIHLPGGDEIGLLRQLRSRPDTSNIPILMVSVNTDLKRMAACFEAGTDGFLIKPFDAAILYRRLLSRKPGPCQGHGRPRAYGGQRFAFKEPQTRGKPTEELCCIDSHYGVVRLRCWHDLHAKQDATTSFSVIRAEVHLERNKSPRPIWLATIGAPEVPVYVKRLWFDQRWPVEPAFRFRKRRLYWTLPYFQHADRCDRWSLLVDVAYWRIWPARHLVTDQPLPWQKPQADLTPGRVTQGLGALFAQVETQASPPRTRGKSPGWPSVRPHTGPKR
jgi:CheY-like chemotaxis protein